jgi:hypothetical protein
MVYEESGKLLGTISLIEDGRVAWLYRFIVRDFEPTVTKELYDRAVVVLRDRGHTQVLVYSSTDDKQLDSRYHLLGMERGGDYACYWQEL